MIKKLTLLHSNDMHGDFLAEDLDKKLVGGVSMLSGYVNRVRSEEENALYVIAGDMFRGSVIDSEYKGISTIEIMNMLSPDVVTIGNHEADYGVPHMLFIEKCANFPIINANLHVKKTGKRLFRPCVVVETGGMKILFIGVITEEILAQAKKDATIGAFVDVYAAADEVRRICDAYKSMDIDLTVLLTHVGIEQDKKLAALLDPSCGVDVIIGGHSHTVMEQPLEINNILIAQAGTGTDYIGRFNIEIDTDKNAIPSYTWRLEPIDATHCGRDEAIEKLIQGYKAQTDAKYGRVVTHFNRALTHPRRNMETELGDLFCDILADSLRVDVVFMGSGSVRAEKLGPIVTYGELFEGFSFKESVHMFKINGAQLRRIMLFLMRDDMFLGTTEFYQIPRSLRLVYSKSAHKLESLTFNGVEVTDDATFSVAMQLYHFLSLDKFLGISKEEAFAIQQPRVIATSDFDIAAEYLGTHNNIDVKVDGRITIKD